LSWLLPLQVFLVLLVLLVAEDLQGASCLLGMLVHLELLLLEVHFCDPNKHLIP
jgi:hypothetical protein